VFQTILFAKSLPLLLCFRFVLVNGVHLEEVVQHDEEHGGAAEEEGERVELGVGDHFLGGGYASAGGPVRGLGWKVPVFAATGGSSRW